MRYGQSILSSGLGVVPAIYQPPLNEGKIPILE